jgi:predicted DNA-binding ArsR family transcriptional regulator
VASFQLFFAPRDISANVSQIRPHIETFKTLQARLLGRADDLEGSFDASATHFSDLIAWDISSLGAEDYQLWVDATVALEYAADVTEQWADYVKEFWDTRDDLWDEWDGAVASAVGRVPAEFAEAVITAGYPEREGFFESIGGSDANICRDLYDELKGKLDDINERAQANYDKYEEHAEEIRTMLEEGATDVNVQKLMDGGYSEWGYYNLDPEKYLELQADFDLTPETARTTAEELAPYWMGDKPLDDRYHELMLVMSMIGTNARNAQNDGTEISDEEIEFLEQFYANVELQGGGIYGGVLSVPEWLEGDHLSEEQREHALGVLGDGLLALSDPELGGGYESLPESVRRAAEGPFLLADESGTEPAYQMSTYQLDAQALSALLRHTDEELQGGYTLSTNLTMSTGSYNYYWGGDGEDSWLTSEELAPLVDVGTRNEDANYYILTGDQPQNASIADLGYPESFREEAVQGLLTFEWHDQGEAAGGLIDWISEKSRSEDPEVQAIAGEAASGFIEIVTTAEMQEALTNTGVDVTEGDDEYKNASFTAFNTNLADTMVDIFDSYIYSFASGEVVQTGDDNATLTGIGDYNPDYNGFTIGPQERAAYLEYLMGNDDAASSVISSASTYQHWELEAYLESGDQNATSRGAASLYGLIDVALEAEAENRKLDLQETEDRKEQIYGFVLDKAAEYSGKVPVVGESIGYGLGLGRDWMIGQAVDQDISTSPRHPTSDNPETRIRQHHLIFLEHISNSESVNIKQPPAPEYVGELERLGVLTTEEDGSVVIEMDATNWSLSDSPGQNMDAVDDALANALGATIITPSNGTTTNAEAMASTFSTPYDNRYELIKSHAPRNTEE